MQRPKVCCKHKQLRMCVSVPVVAFAIHAHKPCQEQHAHTHKAICINSAALAEQHTATSVWPAAMCLVLPAPALPLLLAEAGATYHQQGSIAQQTNKQTKWTYCGLTISSHKLFVFHLLVFCLFCLLCFLFFLYLLFLSTGCLFVLISWHDID